MDNQLHSLFNMSAQSAKVCVLEASLCPSGERCKYKGGGTDSGYDDNVGDYKCGDGYNFMMRERDKLDPSVFNKASRDACMEALADMQRMGIDVRFDPNSCPIHLYDKPVGCYIMCTDDGDKLVGYFNENAWIYIENKYNNAEPLCISPSVFQCKNHKDCDDNDKCTKDKCKKKRGICENKKKMNMEVLQEKARL